LSVYHAILGGLLALQTGPLSAQMARADLRVSATVVSICAISSGVAILPLRELDAKRGAVRVNCTPVAPYRLSLNPAVAWTEPSSALPAKALQRVERRGDVLVVEIAY